MAKLTFDYNDVEKLESPEGDELDLLYLGVDKKYWYDLPTEDSFPAKFSRDVRYVWRDVVREVEAEGFWPNTFLKAWKLVIDLFLQECKNRGVAPYTYATEQAKNAYIHYALRRHRLMLKQFLDDFGLFLPTAPFPIEIMRTSTRYIRGTKGFYVVSWAQMFPTGNYRRSDYEEWLTSMQKHRRRFQRERNLLFCDVWPRLQIWVKTLNMYRIRVGFTIKIDGMPDVPGEKIPTVQETNEFIECSLYGPLRHDIRFRGVTKRWF